MTNPERTTAGRTPVAARFVALGLASMALLTVGCGEEPEPVAVAPTRPQAPPPPPKPTVTPIDQLMMQYGIDERVMLPEDAAPDNDPDRIAVLEFFDAFARGDAESLTPMLSELDRRELVALTATPVWEETIAGITEIRIETGKAPLGDKAALAIFEVNGDFEPQLWYYASEGGETVFDAVATPPNMMERLYGDNFIKLWHDILAEEMAKANLPDEEFEVSSVQLEGAAGSGGSAGGGPGASPGSPSPTSPGGPPGRRKPPPRRAPPGPGGG